MYIAVRAGGTKMTSQPSAMATDNKPGSALLGFLALSETLGRDGYLGAILITDLRGTPQEFRCTHPVKPTAIQKPLYGETLEPYVGVDLCGVPLVESIQQKPSVLVVQKEFLLGVRKASPCPVVFIRRAGEAIDIGAPGTTHEARAKERIDSPAGRFQPIMLFAQSSFEDDLDLGRPFIEKASEYLDPLEPFERIAKAIEVLAKQDKRFQ